MKTLSILALLIFSTTAFSKGDVAKGKAKAMMCSSCHGKKGISSNPMWPNLAGQKEAYTFKQLKDFKSGKRKDPMMGGLVAALTDADMQNLAAYYASLK